MDTPTSVRQLLVGLSRERSPVQWQIQLSAVWRWRRIGHLKMQSCDILWTLLWQDTRKLRDDSLPGLVSTMWRSNSFRCLHELQLAFNAPKKSSFIFLTNLISCTDHFMCCWSKPSVGLPKNLEMEQSREIQSWTAAFVLIQLYEFALSLLDFSLFVVPKHLTVAPSNHFQRHC